MSDVSGKIKFKVTNTKLYVPIVTLSTLVTFAKLILLL